MTRLLLASASARRVEILTALGVAFDAHAVDVDESALPGESARDLVLRLAESKARAGSLAHDGPVLGADTLVVLNERIFGKPDGEESALDMLAALSGQRHQVMTAVALIDQGEIAIELSETTVKFRDIGRDEARLYWHSGEPMGKAGAYAIQGLGGVFVESIAGSYTGVVGLPVFETARLLQRAGILLLPATESVTQ